MQFAVDARVYDKDSLPSIGAGEYGEVFDLGNQRAAKIYHDPPEDAQIEKLLKLFDIAAAVGFDQSVSQRVAMPLSAAVSLNDNLVTGFSMVCFQNWIKLSKLTFNANKGEYWRKDNLQFTDETAVAVIFDLFAILSVLARNHVAIGDISLANIMINPADGKPGFIDMDEVQFEDWESQSLGTEGYVDPNLIDADVNSLGGYSFDARTDVFALTVVAYFLLTGCYPFHLQVLPAPKSRDFLIKNRISNICVLEKGEGCLRQHGLRIADGALLTFLRARLDKIRSVAGLSGNDGEYLYKHFVNVFVEDNRENLLENLPDNDARNPEYRMLVYLRTREVIQELKQKFAVGSRPIGLTRKKGTHLSKDPRAFEWFLNTRGITLSQMVT